MPKTGADLSHYQAAFDAAAYQASGEDFVILKATDRTAAGDFTDPTFAGRWRAAGLVGLPRAAYHFARPGRATVDAQADHFLAVVRAAGWQPGDAWALDLEDAGGLGPALLVAWAERWVGRVRAALGGVGLFYTGVAFALHELGDPGRIPGGCLGWIARYRTDDPWAPLRAGGPRAQPAGWPEVPDVWQCTNGQVGCVHQVASVGACDWNKATDQAFAALFGGRGADMPLTDADIPVIRKALGLKPGEEAASNTDFQVLLRGDAVDPDTHPDNLGSVHADTQAILALLRAVPAALDAVRDAVLAAVGEACPELSDADVERIADRAAARLGRLAGTVELAAAPAPAAPPAPPEA